MQCTQFNYVAKWRDFYSGGVEGNVATSRCLLKLNTFAVVPRAPNFSFLYRFARILIGISFGSAGKLVDFHVR